MGTAAGFVRNLQQGIFQRLTDTKAGWTKEVEEAAKTAQEAAEEAGKKITKSLIKSLNGEKETLKKSMRGIAKDMIEAFKKAFGLGKSNKSAKSTKTSINAKGTTTSGKTTAKKQKAKALMQNVTQLKQDLMILRKLKNQAILMT